MTAPVRIQRKREKGWLMPAGAVYVGRGTRWGSPFRVQKVTSFDSTVVDDTGREWIECFGSHEFAVRSAVRLYALHIGPMGLYEVDPAEIRDALAGKDLACWCPLDAPCHADVLLTIANNTGGDQ